jgi:hypothetical protein
LRNTLALLFAPNIFKMDEIKRYNLLRQQYSQMLARPSSAQRSPKRVTFNFVDSYTIQDLRNLREFRQLELDTFTTTRKSSQERDEPSDLSFSDDSGPPSRIEEQLSYERDSKSLHEKASLEERERRSVQNESLEVELDKVKRKREEKNEEEEKQATSSGEISPAILRFEEEEKKNLEKLLSSYQKTSLIESQSHEVPTEKRSRDEVSLDEISNTSFKQQLDNAVAISTPHEYSIKIQPSSTPKPDISTELKPNSSVDSHDSLMRDIESYKKGLFDRIVNPVISPKEQIAPQAESPEVKGASKRFSELSNIDLYRKFCHNLIDSDVPNPITPPPESQSSVDLSESYLKSKLDHLNKLLQPRSPDICNISAYSLRSAKSDRQLEVPNLCDISNRSDLRSRETSIIEDTRPLIDSSLTKPQEIINHEFDEPDICMTNLNEQKIHFLIRAIINISLTLERLNLEESFRNLQEYRTYYDTLHEKEQLAANLYNFSQLRRCFSAIKSLPKAHDEEFENSHLQTIQDFQARWGFIKLHLSFIEMKRICDAHREWVKQVQASLLHRKLQTYFDSWILFLRYRLAKYSLKESRLKRILTSWRDWSKTTRERDMKAYLLWYKTLISKYTIAWRAFLMHRQLKRIKSSKMTEFYNKKLISKVFLLWKNIRQIIASNYIPMRISKYVSVSKSSGRLIHKKSLDIKIVNF